MGTRRYAKCATKDPHPNMPFYDDSNGGLPAWRQAFLYAGLAFLLTVLVNCIP